MILALTIASTISFYDVVGSGQLFFIEQMDYVKKPHTVLRTRRWLLSSAVPFQREYRVVLLYSNSTINVL